MRTFSILTLINLILTLLAALTLLKYHGTQHKLLVLSYLIIYVTSQIMALRNAWRSMRGWFPDHYNSDLSAHIRARADVTMRIPALICAVGSLVPVIYFIQSIVSALQRLNVSDEFIDSGPILPVGIVLFLLGMIIVASNICAAIFNFRFFRILNKA